MFYSAEPPGIDIKQTTQPSNFWSDLKSLTKHAFLEANSCLSPFNSRHLPSEFRLKDYCSSDSASESEHDRKPSMDMSQEKHVSFCTTKKIEPTGLASSPDKFMINFSPSTTEKSNVETPARISLNCGYSHREDEVYKPRRASSLKPPRSCSNGASTTCKKAVRFANAFGIDLVDVKQIFDFDGPPKIPSSALNDLKIEPEFLSDYSTTQQEYSYAGARNRFENCFKQPGGTWGFLDRVRKQSILLENASVDSMSGKLVGLVRVLSRSFDKVVIARISYNNWQSYGDTPATYIDNSHDGVTDQFSFFVFLPPTLAAGDVVQLALMYKTPEGEEFWDNNYGSNYKFLCNSI
ncbi:Protein phosphatase 1 regulatory subunit 3E [Cichlidogyrus casuarinus]|uniref:Protein phosphatase 1 regulatory subunit 3E n=1 Tax=Cichlidogyrus casuarinus TaxID=1844966 RepID=A0ABD2QK10_9PLAT